MGSSSKGTQSQTTTMALAPEAQQLLGAATPKLLDWAQQGAPVAGFSSVAGFDPLQTQGQEMALGSTGTQGNLVGSAAGGNQFLTSGDVLRPDSNPALRGYMDAATRPIVENLMTEALPAIRGEAARTGNFGGSRQGIAEGLAINKAAQAVGDTTSKIANTAYGQGLGAMTQGLQMAPQLAAAQTIPALTTSGVGDVRQNLAQQMLSEQGQNFQLEQIWPFLVGSELSRIASGIPGGSTTTTASTPQANPWVQGAGLGISALGLLSKLSDRRAKTQIERIGVLFDGTPVYRYKYLGDDRLHVGLMADEVTADAVHEYNGVKFVDYDLATERAARLGGGL